MQRQIVNEMVETKETAGKNIVVVEYFAVCIDDAFWTQVPTVLFCRRLFVLETLFQLPPKDQ